LNFLSEQNIELDLKHHNSLEEIVLRGLREEIASVQIVAHDTHLDEERLAPRTPISEHSRLANGEVDISWVDPSETPIELRANLTSIQNVVSPSSQGPATSSQPALQLLKQLEACSQDQTDQYWWLEPGLSTESQEMQISSSHDFHQSEQTRGPTCKPGSHSQWEFQEQDSPEMKSRIPANAPSIIESGIFDLDDDLILFLNHELTHESMDGG
jgi:hypothetical protein